MPMYKKERKSRHGARPPRKRSRPVRGKRNRTTKPRPQAGLCFMGVALAECRESYGLAVL
jgi:hypothetical protein